MPHGASSPDEAAERLAALAADVIGSSAPVPSPFGPVPCVYADWTASGRALGRVEAFVRARVLPAYANTHSAASATARQTAAFRAEAREAVQLAVNGHAKKDVVLFAGAGATGAVNLLVHVLGLKERAVDAVVFLGPWEHHSNVLPWRESGALVIDVPERPDGTGTDLEVLDLLLQQHADKSLKIGAFSAASNVTGLLEDADRLAATLHRRGAFAFFDYATAGPYVPVDMNPASDPLAAKDAIFLSPHKFPGGAGGAHGVLVAKKHLFDPRVPPAFPGGGSVFFVSADGHRYLADRAEREEGGTPDVVGCVRAGLAFKVKQAVGVATIMDREGELVARGLKLLRSSPNLCLLGPEDGPRLPVFSFLVRFPHPPPNSEGRAAFLHHNFVARLLNDLYGIQVRAGCMCAGPYIQRLLGLSPAAVQATEDLLVGSQHPAEHARPGAVRFSLAYFAPEEEVEHVLEAVREVAEMGWRMLPLYRHDANTGEWGFSAAFGKFAERRWLAIDFDPFGPAAVEEAPVTTSLREVRRRAREIMETMPLEALKKKLPEPEEELLGGLRWFAMPVEARRALQLEAAGDLGEPHGDVDAACVVNPERYRAGLGQSASLDGIESACALPSADGDGVCLPCLAPRRTDAYDPATGTITVAPAQARVSPTPPPLPTASLAPTPTKRELKQPKRGVNGKIGSQRVALPVEPASSNQGTNASAVLGLLSSPAPQLHPVPPRRLLFLCRKAIWEWDMIRPGDRLLLGLSGGKDSLSLLHVLLHLRGQIQVPFELAACTIDPGTEAFDPSPLIPYMARLGVPYHYERTEIFAMARQTLPQGSDEYCSYCARMKRGHLYTAARREGMTALILAQHLDDLAESMYMAMSRNGQLRTMRACYAEKDGLRIIRPLVYVREKETREFAVKAGLPIINENCPACFAAPGERERVKALLKREEAAVPNLFDSLRRAMLPLMDEKTSLAVAEIARGMGERVPQAVKERREALAKAGTKEERKLAGKMFGIGSRGVDRDAASTDGGEAVEDDDDDVFAGPGGLFAEAK
ncbi:hypothetical protein DFJ74DRAFT_668130 [Hyaloraphidium curvatum]|nr:hypothetical protein DFJ74DRAFT_668130 [Hyaloraphidium curvatum]